MHISSLLKGPFHGYHAVFFFFLKFYQCPESGFAYPGDDPGHLTSLSGFGLAYDINMDFKAIQNDRFRKKNILHFWPFVKYRSCIFSSSITTFKHFLAY